MENILLGLQQLANPVVFLALVGGVLLGLSVGALPGLNDSITIAVLIPVTFGMDAKIAMALLVGIYVASACGGSIPAVLLEIPGTASAMVTAYDGYRLRQQGHGLEALSICMTSSVFGGISSALVLLFAAPVLASFALKFGPPEYFMLAVLGISTVIGMAGKDCWKHFLSMGFGLWLSFIGVSGSTGATRFTFGSMSLMDGIPLVPRMIGLFGILSVLKIAEKVGQGQDGWNAEMIDKAESEVHAHQEDKVAFLKPAMCKRLLPTWLRASAIGNILGCMPGAGMTMAIFTAYDVEKKMHPEKEFGTGVIEGIAAPEAANNAVVASSMVPLLSLGIPGNSTSALFVGALTIHGLVAGPTLFTKNPDTAYLIIMAFLVGNILMLPMALAFCKYLAAQILKINPTVLSAAILGLCVTGSFAYKNNPFHIGVAIAFGVIGYLFYKFSVPTAPFILASILGTMMESNYMNSLAYTGSPMIFLQRPISLVLFVVSMIFIVWPWLAPVLNKIGKMIKKRV
ncbi:MAG: tripartite tricarboxylate transporter permease [Lawsonibacter sp.]|nr:tripartite tricarboxylate transporter permease [Lawsonibacter sp.]